MTKSWEEEYSDEDGINPVELGEFLQIVNNDRKIL
jgi:hypothetical protein